MRVDDGLEARIIRDLHVRIDDVLRNCPLQYVHIVNLHLCTVKLDTGRAAPANPLLLPGGGEQSCYM